jgi:hypothetical protein
MRIEVYISDKADMSSVEDALRKLADVAWNYAIVGDHEPLLDMNGKKVGSWNVTIGWADPGTIEFP